jgi:hypothetical protein
MLQIGSYFGTLELIWSYDNHKFIFLYSVSHGELENTALQFWNKNKHKNLFVFAYFQKMIICFDFFATTWLSKIDNNSLSRQLDELSRTTYFLEFATGNILEINVSSLSKIQRKMFTSKWTTPQWFEAYNNDKSSRKNPILFLFVFILMNKTLIDNFQNTLYLHLLL